jgi:hypothetical protein
VFIRLGLGLLGAGLAGFLLVSVILREAPGKRPVFWLRFWLGIGCGLGVTSLHYFLWRLVADPTKGLFMVGELLVLLILFGIYAGTSSANWISTRGGLILKDCLKWPSLLGWVFFMIAGIALLTHIAGFLKKPHGGWDAWMIWNLDARFLFRGGEHWQNLFSPQLVHPDYPLLIPANVARLWSIMGKESIFAPAVLGGIYAVSIIALLVTAVRYLRGPRLGYIAGFALLGSAGFHFHAPTQSADFPLALYILGVLVSINFYDRDEYSRPGFLLLAGLLAGLATWTKNEGWLLLVALILARSAQAVFRRTQRNIWREARLFFAGLAPVLALVLFFKLWFTPANDLVASLGAGTLDNLLDANRYISVAGEFLWQSISLDPKISTPLAMLPLLFLFFGFRKISLKQPGVILGLLVLAIMFAGFAAIFITTPHRLEWHLYTANARLFLQLWPGAVFIVMLLLDS